MILSSGEQGTEGAVDANYTPVGGVGSLAYARRGDSYQIPHKDHLGGTRELTDASEVAIQYYEYDAFGTKLEDAGGQTNRFQFAANYMKLKDHDNIYLSPTRVYHAGIGRFLQKDPIFYPALYIFSMNLPLLYVDPFGTDEESIHKWSAGITATEIGITQLDPAVQFKGLNAEEELMRYEYLLKFKCKYGGEMKYPTLEVIDKKAIPKKVVREEFISGKLSLLAKIIPKIPALPGFLEVGLEVDSTPGAVKGKCGFGKESEVTRENPLPGTKSSCIKFKIWATVDKVAARVTYQFVLKPKLGKIVPKGLQDIIDRLSKQLPLKKSLPIGVDVKGKIEVPYVICCVCVPEYLDQKDSDPTMEKDFLAAYYKRTGEPERSNDVNKGNLKWSGAADTSWIEEIKGPRTVYKPRRKTPNEWEK